MLLLLEIQMILICDADELFRRNLRNVLESKDFDVQEASRPSEAVKYVLKEEFCAAIFNLQSNDLNGAQIFSAIKTIDYKLPVIVVTDSDVNVSSGSSIIHGPFEFF